jgi:hypothetical protein
MLMHIESFFHPIGDMLSPKPLACFALAGEL